MPTVLSTMTWIVSLISSAVDYMTGTFLLMCFTSSCDRFMYNFIFTSFVGLCQCIVRPSFLFDCFDWATCENCLGKWFTVHLPPLRTLPLLLRLFILTFWVRNLLLLIATKPLFVIFVCCIRYGQAHNLFYEDCYNNMV